MNTALNIMSSDVKLPAYLQNFRTGMMKGLSLGSAGRNILSLKGSRFHLIVNGKEEGVIETNSTNVIILGGMPDNRMSARIYYKDVYDPTTKTPPLCYSTDGISPAQDAVAKQATKCALCPQNVKGSKLGSNGDKYKACAYFKRLAVALETDEEKRVFQWNVNSSSMFGLSKPGENKFNMTQYMQSIENRNVEAWQFVTKLSFDTSSSTPRILFSPVRPLDQDELPAFFDLVQSKEVKESLEINVTSSGDDEDSSQEVEVIVPVTPPIPLNNDKEVMDIQAPLNKTLSNDELDTFLASLEG